MENKKCLRPPTSILYIQTVYIYIHTYSLYIYIWYNMISIQSSEQRQKWSNIIAGTKGKSSGPPSSDIKDMAGALSGSAAFGFEGLVDVMTVMVKFRWCLGCLGNPKYGKTSEKEMWYSPGILQICGFWTKPRKRFEAMPRSQFFGGPWACFQDLGL